MLLLDFPNELLLVISESLGSTDLNSLVQCSKCLCDLLTPRLYKLGAQDSALFWAAKRGELAVAIRLLESGSDVDSRNDKSAPDDEYTVLHRAALNEHQAVVKLLLERGCNVNALDPERRTVLHMIAAHSKGRRAATVAIARLLLKAGCDLEACDIHGCTALHWAAHSGNRPLAKLLLKKGLNLRARDHTLRTPLHLAAESWRVGTVKLLLEKGCDANARDIVGKTPLHFLKVNFRAAANLRPKKQVESDGTLLKKSISPMDAAIDAAQAVITTLLEHGCDFDALDVRGKTALHYVTGTTNSRNSVIFLKNTSSIVTPLRIRSPYMEIHRAMRNLDIVVAKVLVEAGAYIGAKSIAALLALGIVPDVVEMLLNGEGGSFDFQDVRSRPAYFDAIKSIQILVELLLEECDKICDNFSCVRLKHAQAILQGTKWETDTCNERSETAPRLATENFQAVIQILLEMPNDTNTCSSGFCAELRAAVRKGYQNIRRLAFMLQPLIMLSAELRVMILKNISDTKSLWNATTSSPTLFRPYTSDPQGIREVVRLHELESYMPEIVVLAESASINEPGTSFQEIGEFLQRYTEGEWDGLELPASNTSLTQTLLRIHKRVCRFTDRLNHPKLPSHAVNRAIYHLWIFSNIFKARPNNPGFLENRLDSEAQEGFLNRLYPEELKALISVLQHLVEHVIPSLLKISGGWGGLLRSHDAVDGASNGSSIFYNGLSYYLISTLGLEGLFDFLFETSARDQDIFIQKRADKFVELGSELLLFGTEFGDVIKRYYWGKAENFDLRKSCMLVGWAQ